MRESELQNEALRETIVALTHENQLLKRRIYGNKTERLKTSELQLSLGDLLDAEKQLQKELDEAVANAHAGSKADGETPKTPAEKQPAKPKGRRDQLESDLPRVLLEICDEDLEKTAKRIGLDSEPTLRSSAATWKPSRTLPDRLMAGPRPLKA